jgi:hypothetical protein
VGPDSPLNEDQASRDLGSVLSSIMTSLTPVIPLNMAEFLSFNLAIIGVTLFLYGVVRR